MFADWDAEELDKLLEELKGDTLAGLAGKAGMEQTDMLSVIDGVCERALHGERLLVSTPPQEGKSTRCSVLFPVWAMMKRPGVKVAVASYSLDLATQFSRRARELTRRLYGPITVAGETRAQDWRVDNGSTYTAVGVGSSFTGRAVDLLIIDDPVKSAEDARSPRARDAVWDWWQSVALTRLAPGAGVMVIMTRWHKDDLAGRLKGEGWPAVNIPAQCEHEDDPLGRKVGEWLQSVRGRTPAQWLATKEALSEYFWRALYQGSPVAVEGKILDPAKVSVVDGNDLVARRGAQCWTAVEMDVVLSWDLAFTGDQGSDYVAGQAWGKRGDDYFLLDRVHGHYSFTETCEEVLKLAARWPQARTTLVERAANGAALIDQLGRRLPLTAVIPRGSKEIRAMACQPLVDKGHVKALGQVWDSSLYNELDEFPSGAHDDQVDAMTQALLNFQPNDFYRMV